MRKIRNFNSTASILLFALLLSQARFQVQAKDYRTQGLCEGFPRVEIASPAGTCVALVADERLGLRMPRRILEVAPQRFWIIDMGSWDKGRGRLLEMRTGTNPVQVRTLLEGLDRPLGLQLGPDRKIYIAEAGSIWRTPLPAAGQTPQRELVLKNLPNTGAHPLKEIAFGRSTKIAGQAAYPLYLNVGSETDSCRNAEQKLPLPCPELNAVSPRAAIYRALFRADNGALLEIKPWAFGLRNSVAFTVLTTPLKEEVLLQGENSIDYPDSGFPPEEFNIVKKGEHYGWPYCVGLQTPARGYERRFDCKKTQKAASLWPAHAAPLAMLRAPKYAQPNVLAHKLVVAWHGHRPAGQRVMAFNSDSQGGIVGKGHVLLGGWTEKKGVRPRGAPTGLTFDHQGRLWVVEDRNKTILMLGNKS
jgi:glucose/arabinose dehydrogenase